MDGDVGIEMRTWMQDLFPICRSLTGNGVRQTLSYIKGILPDLEIHEVATGTQAFDWTVPDEWNIQGARLEHEDGTLICDFSDHNLHVVGYSEPVDVWLDLEELQSHLHSLPDQLKAIPYVTSYYKRAWGFCLPHEVREALKPGRYHAVIDSTLGPGSLSYGDLVLPGSSEKEVMVTTYICHPSMANNELSGPVVVAALARHLSKLTDRRYTYRFVFGPETLGAIVYMSRHLKHLQKQLVAGYVVNCVSAAAAPSMIRSRSGNCLADRVLKHVLRHTDPAHNDYPYLTHRGADERQYCSPRADLPFSVFLRAYYLDWEGYHTSLDSVDRADPATLAASLDIMRQCMAVLENNRTYTTLQPGEPQLGKYGLYPSTSTLAQKYLVRDTVDLLAYADGTNDLLSVAELTDRPLLESLETVGKLVEHGLLEAVPENQ